MADHEADGRPGGLAPPDPAAAPRAAVADLAPAVEQDGPDRFDDPDSLEAGRLLFARPAKFVMGVVKLDQLPPAGTPEVAFAGRSNVGKSSLINALVNQHGLARTSNTPGRTQEINLFDLAGRLTLVDLPGYGFAQAPLEKVKAWTGLVFAYLRGRPNLTRVCLLIDARRGVMPVDLEVMEMLGKAAVPFAAVLTKRDRLRPSERAELEAKLAASLTRRAAALPFQFSTSSKEREGIDLLRASLAKLALPAEPDRSRES
jgi:GTP-binding protein